MGNLSNSSITSLFLITSISTGILSLQHENYNIFNSNVELTYNQTPNIADWKDKAFNNSTDYTFLNEDNERIQTIINFSKKVIEKSTDLESEYVDFVNENFWDLI